MPRPWCSIVFGIFIDLGTVLANELAKAIPYTTGNVKELPGNYYWLWNPSNYYSSSPSIKGFFKTLLLKLWVLGKAILAFIIVSTSTSFVFRIGLMASSIFLLSCGNTQIYHSGMLLLLW